MEQMRSESVIQPKSHTSDQHELEHEPEQNRFCRTFEPPPNSWKCRNSSYATSPCSPSSNTTYLKQICYQSHTLTACDVDPHLMRRLLRDPPVTPLSNQLPSVRRDHYMPWERSQTMLTAKAKFGSAKLKIRAQFDFRRSLIKGK